MRKLLIVLVLSGLALSASAAAKKIVLIAGKPSHPPGMHEFRAGSLLLQSCLANVPGVTMLVYSNGWPETATAFDGADAVVIYADGGGGHPAIQADHLQVLDGLVKKGVGIGFMHYGVEIPAAKGGPEFLKWVGGHYEDKYSVNPMWSPDYQKFPNHPIARGVKPFSNRDEWYFNMRWNEAEKGRVTPILTATPSDTVRKGPYVYPAGPYEHIVQASGKTETMMWAFDRPDGGRGFGFTGGHTHANWGNENQRKVVLNALLWVAKVEVPQNGVESIVSPEQLAANLDPKGGNRPNPPAAVAAAAGGAPANRPGHTSGPEAALAETAGMTPGDGLDVSLFASEPMLVNPTDMDIDARGRIWINEGANYRKWSNPPLRPEGDRIVILEDTNKDGKADKQTVFYQDLSINAALGVCVLGNKVIVSSAPNVFVLTDTDGDGKADKREILFTGISGFQHDHAIHAFVFGPDGKLYFNFGNEGRQLRRPTGPLKNVGLHGVISNEDIAKNSEPVLDVEGNEINNKGKPYREGMVFRCDLDGSNVEVLGWNFRNNYEVAVDSFGTLWQSDNDDDGNRGVRINYVMEFGNYGYKDEMTSAGWSDGWKKAQTKGAKEDERPFYHWHQYDPGVVPNLLQTGAGSPTGIAVYEGKLLPATFRNQVIHCDAGPRVVRAYPVVNTGAGFTATIANVLTSPDSWYRPSDVCVAPDGSLYIADWHDAGVGGHNMADRVLETMTGRVYHITPKGSTATAPTLDFKSTKGCIAALQSPNQETRYLAWMKLHEMQGKAEKELLTLWKSDDARMRARAIQLLARIKGSEKKYVELALKDKDANLRIVGLRMSRSLKLDVVGYVKKLTNDSDAQVRREAAIALRHNPSSEAPALWAKLAQQHDGKDRWYVEALGLSADKNEDAFFSAWLTAVGDQWNTPAGRDIIWRLRSTKAPALLVKLITDKSTTEADKARYLRALDFIKGPEKDKALIELLGVN